MLEELTKIENLLLAESWWREESNWELWEYIEKEFEDLEGMISEDIKMKYDELNSRSKWVASSLALLKGGIKW